MRRTPKLDRRTRLKLAGQAALAALGVFVLLHLPALWEFRQFASSVQGNLRNAETGTGVRVPLALTYGLFHLRHSLLPGLGAPLTVLGLLGFAAPLLAPLERRKPLRRARSIAATIAGDQAPRRALCRAVRPAISRNLERAPVLCLLQSSV